MAEDNRRPQDDHDGPQQLRVEQRNSQSDAIIDANPH